MLYPCLTQRKIFIADFSLFTHDNKPEKQNKRATLIGPSEQGGFAMAGIESQSTVLKLSQEEMYHM